MKCPKLNKNYKIVFKILLQVTVKISIPNVRVYKIHNVEGDDEEELVQCQLTPVIFLINYFFLIKIFYMNINIYVFIFRFLMVKDRFSTTNIISVSWLSLKEWLWKLISFNNWNPRKAIIRKYFFYRLYFQLGTLIPIGRYCPTNIIQANPYKSQGSGYPVDPSV